jgi:drug/metabolite transporter (DMT)-like permease
MSALALSLLLLSAFVHAGWNLAAKQAGGGAAFVWLFSVLGAALCAPVAVGSVVVGRPTFGPVEWVFMAGTVALHGAYFLMLQQGYRHGDLSVVYPLARGAGPMLTVVAAVFLLGERPPPLALAGATLIGVCVFLIAGGFDAARRAGGAAVAYGLLTGTLIAGYTIWDAHAMANLAIPPVLYMWVELAGMSMLLLPWVLRDRPAVVRLWKSRRPQAFAVAVGAPLAYGLVLVAMIATPVTAVAPVRELSILIAAILGARLLGEGDARRRLLAAAGMVAGVVAIAVS